MKRRFPLLGAVLWQIVSFVALADDSQTDIENNWLMLVKTENTDSARDREFNAWYDDIDIPDVLEVPGYMRARRGFGQHLPEFPAADLQPAEGTYIALYDIVSPDLDRTIADMTGLANSMKATGRSTELLHVTERIYYRQHRPAYTVPGREPSGRKLYLYIERSNCRGCEASSKSWDDWFDSAFLPALMGNDGFLRATRYELYRVVMDPPLVVPRFLTVFEIEADSAAAAAASMDSAVRELQQAGQMRANHLPGDATIYLQIKDVARPVIGGAAQ
jgi:hypothetical protein